MHLLAVTFFSEIVTSKISTMPSRVTFFVSALIFALVATIVAAEESNTKEHVLTLDQSNFYETVKKHDFIVVEFYAPWCGHCNTLAPKYEKAAEALSKHDPPLILAKVDADNESNSELVKEFKVGGFPTIKILRDGGKSVQPYKGPRDADGIVAYVKKQYGPATVEIKTKEDASSLINDKDVVIVGVFPKFSGEEYVNFTSLAEKLRSDYQFGHTLDAKLLPRGDKSVSGPLIRLFKPFDELFADSKDFNLETVENFIETSTIPVLTTYDKEPSNHPFISKFFKSPNAKAMLWLNFSNEAADSFRSKYREVAEQNKGEGISFLVGDIEFVAQAPEYFGVTADQVPFIIIESTDGKKYLEKNVQLDSIAPWVKQYKDGKLSPFKKSQPIPETNDEPVKVVVADSLQDLVIDSGKNVLLEFYAPWCGHCKQLTPIYEEVAVSYKDDPDVVIAKFDATANDIPKDIFSVQGFPTLYFRSPSGKLAQYEGNRTKEDIIDFIEKNREKTSQKDSSKDEHVLTLDQSNFHDTLKKHDFIVVEFYAPWCGHCINLAPEYEKAAEVLSRHDPPLVLAKVDAVNESNSELAKEFEIGGFPTIKILRNGGKSIQEYKGPRDADGIVAYVKRQYGPATVEIKSKDDANNLIGDKDVVIVGVFPKFSGKEFESFKALAEKLRGDYQFGHTLDAKLLPRGDASVSGPIIRLFKPFDELYVDFKDFQVDAVERFIETSTIPSLTIYDKDPSNHPYISKFFQSPNSRALLWVNYSDEAADSLKAKYREVVQQNKGQGLNFLLGDAEVFPQIAEYFGLQKEQVPFIIIESKDEKKYVKPNVEPDQIASWVKQYKDGKLSPFTKSQPIPETNDEPVKVVVANSLQDLVVNSGKNVLLEFYAPWCGHCKQLAPILDEVAEAYEEVPDVVLAKFDATANDIPSGFKIEGFPTLYFRSPSGKLVEYDGDRTKESIMDFIEKNREKTAPKDSAKDEL